MNKSELELIGPKPDYFFSGNARLSFRHLVGKFHYAHAKHVKCRISDVGFRSRSKTTTPLLIATFFQN